MTTFQKVLKRELKDPRIKKGFDSLQPERELLKTFIDLRYKLELTQQKLSELTGINQADISKIESGKRVPSLKLITRLADALDMDIKITLVPRKDNKQSE